MFRKIFQRLTRNYTVKQEKAYSKTLTDCFEEAQSEFYVRSHGFSANRVCDYVNTNNLFEGLSQYIEKKYSAKDFRYVGSGDNVVVVQFNNDVVIRFRAPAKEEEISTQSVQQSPFIAPIWYEDEYEGVRINFIPFIPSLQSKVNDGSIPKNIAVEYIYVLLQAGFNHTPPLWFNDYKLEFRYKFEQLGLLKDGTPIIIDHGAIIEEEKAPKESFNRIANDRLKCENVKIVGSEYWDGKWINNEGLLKISTLLNKPEFLQ